MILLIKKTTFKFQSGKILFIPQNNSIFLINGSVLPKHIITYYYNIFSFLLIKFHLIYNL